MQQLDFNSLEKILLSSVLNRSTVQNMFDRVYERFHIPIICFDVSFRLIAYAFEHPFSYVHWEYIAKLGQAPEDFIDGYNYLSAQEKMVAFGKSQIFDTGTSDGYPQACGPVNVDGRLVGYCGIMIEGISKEDAIRLNDLLIRTAAVLLRESTIGTKKGVYLIPELLSGTMTDGESKEKFMKDHPPPYRFAVLKNTGAGLSTILYAGNYLDTYMPVIYYPESSEMLYVMFCSVKKENVYKPDQLLRKLSEKYHFCSFISDFYDDPADTSAAQSQAMLAFAAAGDPAKAGFVDFRECYQRIIFLNAKEFLGWEAAANPYIQKIRNEPQGAEELIQTLYKYLTGGRKISEAARELNIHKNTVMYRLRRISGISGVDPEDNETAFDLLMGMLAETDTAMSNHSDREHEE